MRLNDLAPEEIDNVRRISGLQLHQLAMGVMSNIWPTSQVSKAKLERVLLRRHELSFAAFFALFIVWISEPVETREIATSQGVTRATVSSTISLLEERGLVTRRASKKDRRLVLVELTRRGKMQIQSLFPEFIRLQKNIACTLSRSEQGETCPAFAEDTCGNGGRGHRRRI